MGGQHPVSDLRNFEPQYNTRREVVLADASMPFRAHYGLRHFFRFPKTRLPVLHSVMQDHRRETN